MVWYFGDVDGGSDHPVDHDRLGRGVCKPPLHVAKKVHDIRMFFFDTLLSLRFLSSCSHGESTSYVNVCVDLLC